MACAARRASGRGLRRACSDAGGAHAPGQVLATGAVVGVLPGVAVYYSDSLAGLPPVFEQLLATAPALHRVIIFLHIRQVLGRCSSSSHRPLHPSTPSWPAAPHACRHAAEQVITHGW